jgi:cytochrome c-type biogenesis protein CcmH/NrfG
MYWLQKNDMAKAKSQFEYSVKIEPSNPGGFYYLALIAAEQRDAGAALAYLQKSINANPSFKPAYELAIRIHEQSGNTDQANRIRAMIQQIK